MENIEESTWYTGDWRPDGNNSQAPYNGLKIVATANYSEKTNPPTARKLVSVDLEVVDYTYNPNGVSSSLQLTKPAVWYPIPIPTDTTVSPPEPNMQFTVVGIGGNALGNVKLDDTPRGSYLNIQFSYGPTSRKREEIGYIMRFPNQDDTIEEEA
ncbi:hypothetical protein D3C87_70410 [compost metagenome]